MTPRIVETADDHLLANFYHQHWLDMGIDPAEVAADWRARALDFIATARRDRGFTGFVALDGETPVGGACCHQVDRVYPAFRRGDAARVGYIWGVYVAPAARGRRFGTALVNACIARLAAQGCERVVLHAGDRAKPIYERLGFEPTDELALTLGSDEHESIRHASD